MRWTIGWDEGLDEMTDKMRCRIGWDVGFDDM